MKGFEGLLGNPMFQAGMGILSANAPSLTPPNYMGGAMKGLMQGAQYAQQQKEMEMKKKLYDIQVQEAEAKREANLANKTFLEGMPLNDLTEQENQALGVISLEARNKPASLETIGRYMAQYAPTMEERLRGLELMQPKDQDYTDIVETARYLFPDDKEAQNEFIIKAKNKSDASKPQILSKGAQLVDAKGNVLASNIQEEEKKREIRTDVNGVPRYVDTGEPVFTGVLKTQEEKDLAKEKENQTKREFELSMESDKQEMLDEKFNEVFDNTSWKTTGFIGWALSKIPSTDAYDLAKDLDTIKANIGFDKLDQMRQSSPTGGALGQVSERENTLLQQVWGSVDQAQSREEFERAIANVQKQVRQSWDRISEAYEKDYGVPMPEELKPDFSKITISQRLSQKNTSNARQRRAAELTKKYLGN